MPSCLENVFVIILLWASEGFEKLLGEELYACKIK